MSLSADLLPGFQPARLGLAAEAERLRLEADDARMRQSARANADAAITAAVADWHRRTTPVLDELADLVVDAALDLAEATIGRELAAVARPETARLALRRALAPLTPGAPVVVRMNPQDLQTIDSTTAHEGHLVQLVADASLAVGDAVAEQDGATVDARVASALARARAVARG
jgi:flagellar assembly protein FliH